MERIDLRQAGKAFFISKEQGNDTVFPIYYVTNFVQPQSNSANAYLELLLIGGYDTITDKYISADDTLLANVERDLNSDEFDFLALNNENALKEQGYTILNYNDTLNKLLAEREGKDTLPAFEIEDGVLKKYNGHDQWVIIPDNVSVIGEGAFERNKVVEKVSFPNSLKSIEKNAFAYCDNLDGVSFKSACQLESIGIAAFNGCKKMRYFKMPDTVSKIENYAFAQCKNIMEISLPNITVVPFGAFQGCNNLKKVSIDEGVVSIAGEAFWGCTSLEKVSVPSTLVEMGQAAFNKCSSLKYIELPEGFNTSVLKYAELPQNCSYNCCIPDYSRYKGMTLSEFFKDIKDTDLDRDFDVGDETFDVLVCCCSPNPQPFSPTKKEPYDYFTDYIYDNVKIVNAKPDKDFVVADWTGFVEERFDKLKEFSRQYWRGNYDDKDDFTYEWINEIHAWLAGNVCDENYNDFLRVVAGEDIPSSKKEEKDLLSTVYGESEELDLTGQEKGRS